MRLLLLLGLVGCDQIYGLTGRQELDAAPPSDGDLDVDEMIDDGGRVTCPTSGAPQFEPLPRSVVGDCAGYTTSSATGLAMMTCQGQINEGPIGTPSILPANLVVEQGHTILDPRLSPDGLEMYVTSRSVNVQTIRVYQRTGGEWRLGSNSPLPVIPLSEPLFASPPSSSSGERHLIVHHLAGMAPMFSEYIFGAGWELERMYTPNELGVSDFSHPSMTPDGLHLVFMATPVGGGVPEVRYASRPTTSVKFDASVKLVTGLDNVTYPHLAADCSRLYLTLSGAVVYLNRQ